MVSPTAEIVTVPVGAGGASDDAGWDAGPDVAACDVPG
jgi:hypothetical protein